MDRTSGCRRMLQNPPIINHRDRTKNRRKIWDLQKEKRNTFENLLMVLTKKFEDVIDPALHTGSRGLEKILFENTKPYDVIAHIHSLYGKPSSMEIEGALLRLNEPMNRSHPIEVMLQGD